MSFAGHLLGMGNPLLDISNTVTKETLEKYEVKPGDAILAEPYEKYEPLFKELAEKEGVQYIAGGATQNSIRVAQWMLQEENATGYFGCVGKDENGKKLEEQCKKDGVNCVYMVDESVATGTCATCIADKERSLVTNLSAANNYKVDHLQQAENMAILEKAKIVYSAGFFMTVCPEAMEVASKHCNKEGKTYCLNLSAPFLMEVPPFRAVLDKTMPYVDFLFGNETEAATYAKTAGWSETDVPSIAKKLAALPKEGGKPRTVVITQGSSPTCVCINGEVTEYPVLKLPDDKIVDTNGAGDAYVGGFLSGLVLGKETHYCCQAGAFAASVIVQRSGCTFPATPEFSYSPPSVAGHLLGMGNPLLDISNSVTKETLEKYEVKPGDAILAEPYEKYEPLFKELAEKEGVQYIAGGATQNSIRVAQWMLQEENATGYFGCIGKDENGKKLEEQCKKDGVNCVYMVDENVATGTCATCIVDKERSLVTNLSAANNYKVDHLKQADNMAILEKAKIVYSAGFFMTVCPDAMEVASKHCNKEGKTYCLNLSAPFLMEVPPFKAVLDKTMPYVDFLFGNETEAATYAKVAGWSETDVPSIAKKLAALPKEGDRPRTVVITQGSSPTCVCINGGVTEYPILALPAEKLVDTNGAGDAYVGGFLSGLVLGKDTHYCCQAGAFAASVIVQRSGCTFPATPNFSYCPPS